MVNLEKGAKVILTKEDGSTLTKAIIGLGWDCKQSGAAGADFDLDASLYMLDANGKIAGGNKRNFIYFGNLTSPDGSIVHTGDNLTGEGDGDDEQIKIDLAAVPAEVEKLVVVVNIYQADTRHQNFGMVENSFIRLVDISSGEVETLHFDLNFDASTATGVKFATIFRKNGGWAFSADQVEFDGGLAALNVEYGV